MYIHPLLIIYLSIGAILGFIYWVKLIKECVYFDSWQDYFGAPFTMLFLPIIASIIWPLGILGFIIKIVFRK